MARIVFHITILGFLIFGLAVFAQDNQTDEVVVPDDSAQAVTVDIDGTWITLSGNEVELTVDGTEVTLYFPDYARYKTAMFNGTILIYITHYNDPGEEECYIDVPESEFDACKAFVHAGDERHRFTLSLSEDGSVLAGVKEISVLQCEWDTDENGNTSNHMPTGYRWVYHSDYQWRRPNCNYDGLPPLDGNAIEKYDLIQILFTRFGLASEFSLDDFEVIDRIRFVYDQSYLDADTGVFVPWSETSDHEHLEPLDGRVILDEETGEYTIELYPYTFDSYPSLLTGLTILCYQVHELEELDEGPALATTQIEIDSVDYAWSQRHALCVGDNELFDHHIDFLHRALQFRALAGN
jgi:hypothetical protein